MKYHSFNVLLVFFLTMFKLKIKFQHSRFKGDS